MRSGWVFYIAFGFVFYLDSAVSVMWVIRSVRRVLAGCSILVTIQVVNVAP